MRKRKPEKKKNYTEEQLGYYQKMYKMYDRVYRYLLVNVSCQDDAWDLAQDTYMKAWKSLDRINNDRHLDRWIMKIANNTLKDYYRKRKRDREHFFLVENPSEIEIKYRLMSYPPESDPFRNDALLMQISNKEDMEKFLKALDQLEEKYSELLKLWIFGQFSEREISDITGVNYNTVRTRITTGRKLATKIYFAMKGGEPDEDK